MLIERFAQANRDRFKIAPGEAAVSRKSFGHYQDIAFATCEFGIVGTQEAADVAERVFLGGHGAAVRVAEHLARDFYLGDVGIALFPAFDEV